MSRTYRGEERKIRVRGIRRKTDTRRLARALIELEYQRAQEEVEAKAEHSKDNKRKSGRGKKAT
jgi:hypothetical protein